MLDVFISHSSKDKDIAESVIHDLLIGSLNITPDRIFCTTTDGTKIDCGKDWRNKIKAAITDAKIVLLIVTPNYKESEVCCCEMGAAWVANDKVLPLFVEPITYENVGILQNVKQSAKMTVDEDLDSLYDQIRTILNIKTIGQHTGRWNQNKQKLKKNISEYLSKNPFPSALCRDKFEEMIIINDSLQKTIVELKNDNNLLKLNVADLKKIKDKEEVKKVTEKYVSKSILDDFNIKCNSAGVMLKRVPDFVRRYIYVEYSGKNIIKSLTSFDTQDLNDAIAKDYIEDSASEVIKINRSSPTISKIFDSLDDLTKYIEDTGDIHNAFNEKYPDVTLSLANSTFWKVVLGIPVKF